MSSRYHIRMPRVACALIAGAALTLSLAGGAAANTPTPGAIEIQQRSQALQSVSWTKPGGGNWAAVEAQILSINDFHGQLTAGKKVSNRPVGSAAVLASYLEAASEGKENCTIIVEAGDMVGASPPQSALLQDEPTIQFFNMLGNRFCRPGLWSAVNPLNNLVGIPGNHEFDEGITELTRLVCGGNHAAGPFLQDPWRGAGFPMVCANVAWAKSGRLVFAPYSVKLVNGERVAFVGAVLDETPTMVTPSGVASLVFKDEADSINKQVKTLKRMGIHSIVVVLHQGGTQTSYNGATDPAVAGPTGPVAEILSELDGDVDVVVTGHSHGFTNALVPNAAGQPMLVVQAWSAGTAYADIDLQIDRKTGDVVAKSAQIVTTWADEGPGLTPDADAAALTQAAGDIVAPLVDRVVGTAAADISRTQNAAGESALGNLIGDAMRSTMVADFAFMNPGGIRADIYAGEVTWGELYTVQPFNNTLVRMALTGQQIYDLLNQQWAGQPYPRVLQISGLTYTWDALLPQNDCIVEVRKDGVPIDRAAAYVVVTNSYLADGGDNFSVFKASANKIVGPVDLDALVDYISSLGGDISATIEGRITRLN